MVFDKRRINDEFLQESESCVDLVDNDQMQLKLKLRNEEIKRILISERVQKVVTLVGVSDSKT